MALLFFWGLARVPMAQAITLAYIAPILALLFAAVALGERVGRRVILASVLAFAGVFVYILQGSAAGIFGAKRDTMSDNYGKMTNEAAPKQ